MSEVGNLSGMTVNERLFVLGLMDKYDKAKAERDEVALRRIFAMIELPDYDLNQLYR